MKKPIPQIPNPTTKVSGTCSCGFTATARTAEALRQHLGSHDTYHAYLITAKVVAS